MQTLHPEFTAQLLGDLLPEPVICTLVLADFWPVLLLYADTSQSTFVTNARTDVSTYALYEQARGLI